MVRRLVIGSVLLASVLASAAKAQAPELPVAIHRGSCDNLRALVAELSPAKLGGGDPVGAAGAAGAAESFTTIDLPASDLWDRPHALVAGPAESPSACGDIGGELDPDGGVAFGLREVATSGVVGVAYVAPDDDPERTWVAVSLANVARNPAQEDSPPEVEAAAPAAAEQTPPGEDVLRPLVGNVGELLPLGSGGAIEIVAVGSPVRDTTVPLLIRNTTAEAVSQVSVTGTVRDADGQLVASGEDQGFLPNVVEPGGYAIGYVYFGSDNLADSDSLDFEFDIDTSPEPNSFRRDLEITEISVRADRIVGTLSNPLDIRVSTPNVMALCLDADGTPSAYYESTAEQDALEPGASGSFQIELYGGQCDRYLIGASGFTF